MSEAKVSCEKEVKLSRLGNLPFTPLLDACKIEKWTKEQIISLRSSNESSGKPLNHAMLFSNAELEWVKVMQQKGLE